MAPLMLSVPGRALVLVAGIPGAGKSTLLGTLAPDPGTVVLDSDAHRAALRGVLHPLPYGWYRWLVHLWHRLSVLVAAFSSIPTVVVHLPATAVGTRAAVLRVAALSGRAPHLLWLDVDAATARSGQAYRGRVVPGSSFERHVRAAAVPPAADGWESVTVADRAEAAGGLVLQALPAVSGSRTGQ
ncbi:AAA family ATPase [Pseudonocardia sp. CA-107938]|uniref:AAA family ATPase n=1 Tax=Pseudonocardia sp. CA-107938 TaxID=3240021 RepID=UPI003D93F1BF